MPKSNTRRDVVLVLVGSAIAAAAAIGGALVGSHATIVTQRDQAREARQAEARTKRARVYTAFLDEAEQFAAATRRIADTTEAILTGKESQGLFAPCFGPVLGSADPGKVPLSKRCRAFVRRIETDPIVACDPHGTTRLCRAFNQARAAYQPIRADFQEALNDVYVYGTPNSVRAARRVSSGLPASLPTKEPIYGAVVEERKFAAGYGAFLDVMCREVSADPRPNC